MCDRCDSVFVAKCMINGNYCMLCRDCAKNATIVSIPIDLFVDTLQMNTFEDTIGKKNKTISWVAFVSKWNQHQAFHNDIYAIPKKGGITYTEVKEVYDLQKQLKPESPQTPKPEPPKPEAPKPEVLKPEPKEESLLDRVIAGGNVTDEEVSSFLFIPKEMSLLVENYILAKFNSDYVTNNGKRDIQHIKQYKPDRYINDIRGAEVLYKVILERLSAKGQAVFKKKISDFVLNKDALSDKEKKQYLKKLNEFIIKISKD